MKRASASLLVVGLIIAMGQSASAWTEVMPKMDEAGINIEDSWITTGSQTSRIISLESRGAGKMPNERLCEGFGADYCNFDSSKYQAEVTLLLPTCTATTAVACIDAVAYGDESNFTNLTHTGDAGGHTTKADLKRGLPAGGKPSLWMLEGASQSFAVHAALLMNYDRASKKFKVADLEISLIPFVDEVGNYKAPETTGSYNSYDKRWQVGTSMPWGCVWASQGHCGKEVDFTNTTASFKVTVNLPKSAGTWFRGRINSPSIQVSSLNAATNRIAFSGKPMETLKAYVKVPKTEIGKPQLDWLCEGNCSTWFPTVINLRADYPNAPTALEAFRDLASDSSVAVVTKWSFGVIPPFNDPCLKDTTKVNGFVSTNASVYQATSPSFDGKSLNYKVSSYHFGPDGEVSQGVYNLLINSKTARCLYGFSSAPISANVQVIGTNGEQQVVTNVLGESNGWIRLQVAGFHYSSDKIKVTFAQEKSTASSQLVTGTLAAFRGTTTSLSASQKTALKNLIAKADANTKFICTGTYVNAKDKVTAIKRARAACDYAKSLNANFSFWSQSKQTKAKSYDNKVMITSK